MAEKRETTKYTCGGCDTRWTGLTKCHCAACHATFGGAALFDSHRTAGVCADPGSIIAKKGARVGEPVMRYAADGCWRDAREFDPAIFEATAR